MLSVYLFISVEFALRLVMLNTICMYKTKYTVIMIKLYKFQWAG